MKTILFADEQAHVRQLLKEQFEEEGYRVVLAQNGGEALTMAGEEHPDVAVLDLLMPRAGGVDVAEIMMDIHPDLPVIFFTAHDDVCQRDPRACRVTACIEKSEDLTELKRIISAILAGDTRRRHIRCGLPPIPSPSNHDYRASGTI
ncbi:MAG: response regulator [Pirellulales bacterium]|nr:response regulator [Pirellulales bacterium]